MADEPTNHLHDIQYQEGQDAYLEQKQLSDNPYQFGTTEYNRWNAGYLDTKEEG